MPKFGPDEQKPDMRLDTLGNAAIDADAQKSFGGVTGKSGGDRRKDDRLNLGGLVVCRTNRLLRWQHRERDGEKSAEAIVAHCIAGRSACLLASEGPNSLMQGAV